MHTISASYPLEELSRIYSIEKDIFSILKTRSKNLSETALILGHLLYCAGSSIGADPDVLFQNLSEHYKKMYPKKTFKLKF